MKNIFREYFMLIFYSLISVIIITIFFAIISGPESAIAKIIGDEQITNSMSDKTYQIIDQGTGDNTYGEYDKINETDVYFNIVGQVLPYGIEYNWEDYIKFKDDEEPDAYINDDGSENLENEHCFALIKTYNEDGSFINQTEVDLTSYVTPANYTNEHPIPVFDYLNETPREYEVTIEIVPYILNWEDIHVKKNVAYIILPKDALLTFVGRAVNSDGQPFINKRIVFFKGDREMALTQTNTNGEFVIGVKNRGESQEDLNNQDIMPIGEYRFVIDAEGVDYSISYPEDEFDVDEGESTTIELGTVELE